MENIKVLHLSSEKIWRGGEQQIAYLIEELKPLGVTNYVAVREKSPFVQYCKDENIVAFSLPFKNSLDIKTAIEIKSICLNERIDIVHLHSSKSHGIGVLSKILGNKVPFVLSRRVSFPIKNNWFTKFKYNFSAIERIICVSENIKKIVQNYINKPEKCVTIYDGIDLEKFDLTVKTTILKDEFNISRDSFIIGNTSALESEKDYVTFIKTIKILVQNNNNVHAFIIGKGSEEFSLKELVNKEGLNDFITFTGFRNDIDKILPELDLFLMPSKSEGLGTSILDSFIAKTPVVATHAGGIPEIVIHEKTGMLAPIGDAETLSIHIEKIIKNPDFKMMLIDQASDKVLEFSKKEMAIKTFKVYTEIVKKV
jgi:glycosyltransferase involved in cell wall biosynthesis